MSRFKNLKDYREYMHWLTVANNRGIHKGIFLRRLDSGMSYKDAAMVEIKNK